MDPILIIIVAALLVAAWLAGRWYQRQQDPLAEEGRLLDAQLKIAKRIAELQAGETAEQIAERARQAKVQADINALGAKNLVP